MSFFVNEDECEKNITTKSVASSNTGSATNLNDKAADVASLNNMTLNEYNLPQDVTRADCVNVKNVVKEYATAVLSRAGTETESAIESSDEESSLGSEFGESYNANHLTNKLPQVKKDIATLLKLNVSFRGLIKNISNSS